MQGNKTMNEVIHNKYKNHVYSSTKRLQHFLFLMSFGMQSAHWMINFYLWIKDQSLSK